MVSADHLVKLFTFTIRFQLPPSATYAVLRNKCSEFGEVQRVDEKGSGTCIVTFASEWDAERAISILSDTFLA